MALKDTFQKLFQPGEERAQPTADSPVRVLSPAEAALERALVKEEELRAATGAAWEAVEALDRAFAPVVREHDERRRTLEARYRALHKQWQVTKATVHEARNTLLQERA